jgi:tRNA/tmRNA/rRNA uracil-C5-methylase (TrmA/RlmC/RlmD family)
VSKPEIQEQILDVTIEKIVPNGFGLGHVEGLTVMVQLVAPGDKVRVKTGKRNGNLVFAQLEEILEPSPLRVEPGCKYFGRCGGCNFQQLSYEEQLKAKVAIVADCLRRIAKLETPPEIHITPSEKPWQYRSRASWHLDTAGKKIGYFYRNSNEVCDINECPKLLEPLQAELTRLRSELHWGELWSSIAHIDAAGAGGEISLFSEELAPEPSEITFESNGFHFSYNARVFFQGNPYVTPKLVEAAVKDLRGDVALDLYCGVGLFTLPLAQKFSRVVGVEENPESIELARKNAQRNRLHNIDFTAADVGAGIKENRRRLRGLNTLLLDPPRVGVEKRVVAQILELAPRDIVYVSCDPATLARDLKALFAQYELTNIAAFDMFPQTHHVETVAKLTLKR